MTDAAYRDEDAALVEQRTQLLTARRTDEARAASRARVAAMRNARVVWGGASFTMMVVLLSLDLFAPDSVARPAGVTVLGHVLLLAPLVSLAVFPLGLAWAGRARAFVTTSDVRADVDRLRAPLEPPAPQGAAIVPMSFGLPLGALALWPPLFVLHASIDLVRAPLRYYEMMPGLVERRMGEVEALAQLLGGGAMLALASAVAYAIAIARAVTRPSAADTGGTIARLFGGIFAGALIGQLFTAWAEESASTVALGYASLALGALVGVFVWRALFTLVARVRMSEQKEDA